jgi:hypothetical protein
LGQITQTRERKVEVLWEFGVRHLNDTLLMLAQRLPRPLPQTSGRVFTSLIIHADM